MTEIILAFDIGLKRTGVAVGQTLTRTTQAAGQLLVNNGQFDWPEVDKLIAKWAADRVLIGDPKSDEPRLNKVINRFKHHLRHQHKLPIQDWDEAYTSASANAELGNYKLSKKSRIEMRDQLAACLILQAYFDQLES